MKHYLQEERFAAIESAVQQACKNNLRKHTMTEQQALDLDAHFPVAIDAILDQTATSGVLPVTIKFVIFDAPECDIALVTSLSAGFYCIAISDSIFRKIVCLSGTLAATSAFCELFNIDSPDRNNPRIPASPLWLSDHLRTPRSRPQFELMASLNTAVLQFIIAHEVAHIGNGHLDMGGCASGISEVQPLDALSPEETLLSQCREWDADCAGVMWTLRNGLLSSQDADKLDRVKICFFAVSAIWRMLENGNPINWQQSHPPTVFRQRIAGETIMRYLDKWSQDPAARAFVPRQLYERTNAVIADIVRLSFSAQVQAGAPMSADEMSDAYGDRGNAMLAAIIGKWSDIQPTLDQVKPGKYKISPRFPE